MKFRNFYPFEEMLCDFLEDEALQLAIITVFFGILILCAVFLS
jgi:hypothetical protein